MMTVADHLKSKGKPLRIAARLGTAVFLLCFLCGRVHAQEEEEGSIHEMEWDANKGRMPRDEKAPIGLMRQPMVKRKVDPMRRRVVGFHPHWADASYRKYNFDLLSTVLYFGFDVDTATGRAASVYTWPTTNLVNVAHAAGVSVCLAATNFGARRNSAILRSPAKRSTLIRSLLRSVTDRAAEGVHIDFENVARSDRDSLVVFMRELSSTFHQALPDPEISMAIPAVDWRGAYDVDSLEEVCNYLVLMGYDFRYAGSPTAGAVAPLAGESLNVTSAVHNYLARGLPPSRLVLGVPYYGYAWPTTSGSMNANTTGPAKKHPVKYSDHKTHSLDAGPLWDVATSSPWYRYRIDDQWHQAWFEDSASLSLKYRLVDSLGLAGISVWALSYDAPHQELWNAIRACFAADSNDVACADFGSISGLTLFGGAGQHGDNIRLLADSTVGCGGLWCTGKQDVHTSFSTSFRFTLEGGTPPEGDIGGESFAFVIHNCEAPGPGTAGDHSGLDIVNSLVLAFDVGHGIAVTDPSRNVLNVRVRGRKAVGAEGAHFTSLTSDIPDLVDGKIHAVHVRYERCRLRVSIDDRSDACVDMPLDLPESILLDSGKAWVGFIGPGTVRLGRVDLLSWMFAGSR